MAKRIVVDVPRDGISTGKAHTSIRVEGVAGESCRDISAAFVTALGTAVEDKPTEEMYQGDAGMEQIGNG